MSADAGEAAGAVELTRRVEALERQILDRMKRKLTRIVDRGEKEPSMQPMDERVRALAHVNSAEELVEWCYREGGLTGELNDRIWQAHEHLLEAQGELNESLRVPDTMPELPAQTDAIPEGPYQEPEDASGDGLDKLRETLNQPSPFWDRFIKAVLDAPLKPDPGAVFIRDLPAASLAANWKEGPRTHGAGAEESPSEFYRRAVRFFDAGNDPASVSAAEHLRMAAAIVARPFEESGASANEVMAIRRHLEAVRKAFPTPGNQ